MSSISRTVRSAVGWDHRARTTNLRRAGCAPGDKAGGAHDSRKAAMRSAAGSACSISSRCPAPGTISSSAPGIRAARMRALTGGHDAVGAAAEHEGRLSDAMQPRGRLDHPAAATSWPT